jgi:hypothetical protein
VVTVAQKDIQLDKIENKNESVVVPKTQVKKLGKQSSAQRARATDSPDHSSDDE